MNTDRIEELVGLLVEDALPAAGQRELADALGSDEALRQEALDIWQQAAGLSRLLGPTADAAAVEAGILDAIRQRVPSSVGIENGVLENIRRVQGGAARRAPSSRIHMRGRPIPARTRVGRSPRVASAWRLPWAIAACLLIGAGLLVFDRQVRTVRLEPAYARLEQAQGVRITRTDGTRPARDNVPLRPGDTIDVAAGGRAVILYGGENTRLEANERTRLRMDEAEGKRVAVEAGTILADVALQPPDRAMQFATPHARVSVRGTRFLLSVEPVETRVEMHDGSVEVLCLATGESAMLRENEHALVAASLTVAAAPVVARTAPEPAERVRAGLVALYTFQEGRGAIVRDMSGVGPPLDLIVEDLAGIRWLPGGGLATHSPTRIASREPARKLIEACMQANELTIEAWLTPHHLVHPFPKVTKDHWPRRIVTLSADTGDWNFVFGQGCSSESPTCYLIRLALQPSVEPALWRESQMGTPPADLRIALTHVVVTADRFGNTAFYIDGVERVRRTLPQTFALWNPDFRLALANEFGDDDRSWFGTYHLVALYGRALPPDDVRRNFQAGPGGTQPSARN